MTPLIADLRVVKSSAEVAVIQQACEISSSAINKAMAKVGTDDPITSENVLAKYLEYEFAKGGCEKHAYIPVIANGANALCMHYTRNDDLLWEDDLVFIDAGGKLGGYCADISRAWPNNQQGFSGPQKIYTKWYWLQIRNVLICVMQPWVILYMTYMKFL